MHEHRRMLARAAAAGLCLALSLDAAGALASFTSAPSAPSMTVSTATLAAPSGLGATNTNCVVLTSTQVRLDWTATSSSWADGYEILRALVSGGPYTAIGTVSGQGTTTYTDTTVTFSLTYHYVVRATRNNWRSGDSNQASITTPGALCV